MQTLGDAKIAALLGVSLHTERQHETIQGLTVGQIGGPGWELVQLLKTLLNETGKVLVNGGYPSLGSFVAEAMKEGDRAAREKADPTAAADAILERVRRRSTIEKGRCANPCNFPARARHSRLSGHGHDQRSTCVTSHSLSEIRTYALAPRAIAPASNLLFQKGALPDQRRCHPIRRAGSFSLPCAADITPTRVRRQRIALDPRPPRRH